MKFLTVDSLNHSTDQPRFEWPSVLEEGRNHRLKIDYPMRKAPSSARAVKALAKVALSTAKAKAKADWVRSSTGKKNSRMKGLSSQVVPMQINY